MSKIDQGYKLMYIYILFLMFIHVYFILFFSENKARLSAKIRSKKWRNKIKGESFDGNLFWKEAFDNGLITRSDLEINASRLYKNILELKK